MTVAEFRSGVDATLPGGVQPIPRGLAMIPKKFSILSISIMKPMGRVRQPQYSLPTNVDIRNRAP